MLLVHWTLVYQKILTGKTMKQPKYSNIAGQEILRTSKGTIRAGQNFQCCLIL